MIPEAVALFLDLDPAILLATVQQQANLIKALNIARGLPKPKGVYQRFITEFIAIKQGVTRAVAGDLYSAAVGWEKLSTAFGAKALYYPIPQELHREVITEKFYAQQYGYYRYRIAVTLTDAKGEEVRVFGYYKNSNTTLSVDDINKHAQAELAATLTHYPELEEGVNTGRYEVTVDITDYVHFVA